MSKYLRSIAHQSRATDEIYCLLQPYEDGVTVRQLMRDNEMKDANTVLAALDLLVEEGKIRRETSKGHKDHLDGIKVYSTMTE